jgi:hypothetical protein
MLFHYVNVTPCLFTAKVMPKDFKTKPFKVHFFRLRHQLLLIHICIIKNPHFVADLL